MKTIALIGEEESNNFFNNYLKSLLKTFLSKNVDFFLKNELEESSIGENLYYIHEGYSGLNSEREFVSGIKLALELSSQKGNLIIFSSTSDFATLKEKYSDFSELMKKDSVAFFRTLQDGNKLTEVFNSLVSRTLNLKLQK